MVVWENGQDSCDRFLSWSSVFKKECVRGLSQERIFLQEAGPRVQCLLVTAIATAGHSGKGRCVEWCHCLRDSVRQWTLEWKPSRWLLCLTRSPAREVCSAPSAGDQPQGLHSPGASGLSHKGSDKEPEVCASGLHGRAFSMGLGSVWCDFSFPFSPIQVGTGFFLVDHSCPDVAIYFYVSVEKYFSFISRMFFLPPKENIRTLCPLSIVTYQCWQLSP